MLYSLNSSITTALADHFCSASVLFSPAGSAIVFFLRPPSVSAFTPRSPAVLCAFVLSLSAYYDKRFVLEDGIRTEPIEFHS